MKKSMLLKAISVFAAVMLLLTLAACEKGGNNSADSSNTSGSESDEPAPSSQYFDESKVSDSAMPTDVKNATMTTKEMLAKYRPHTDYRIQQIRTTTNTIKPKNGGTAYYVSSIHGKTSNNGLSEKTPVASLSDLNSFELKSGDVVYLERGSIFRESYKTTADGVTYTAYGKGNKPLITNSPENGGSADRWSACTDAPNVYRFKGYLSADVGNISLDDRNDKVAVKCFYAVRTGGSTYDKTTGKAFSGYKDLDNLHFWLDRGRNLYLRCDEGNPGKVFKSIEFGVYANVFTVANNNITVDNICIKYGGRHGIGAGTNNGLTVQNCEFGWLGGSADAGYGDPDAVRLGNAVEIYGGATNYTVTNCYIYQCYDTGITFQYNVKETDSPNLKMENIKFKDNVIEYCNYSIEWFFVDPQSLDTRYMKNISVDNNLMWYCGYGLCEQRPDKRTDCHIQGGYNYRSVYSQHGKGNITITNNLFAIGKRRLIRDGSVPFNETATYSNNTYIQTYNMYFGSSNEKGQSDRKFDENIRSYIESQLKDKKATIIRIKD